MAGAHADGELIGHDSAELEAHLHDCARCREHIAWLRALHQSLKKTASSVIPKAPEHLRRRAQLAIQQNGKPSRNSSKQFDRMIGKPALALAAAAGFAAAFAADTMKMFVHPVEMDGAQSLSSTSLEKAAEAISASLQIQPNSYDLLDDLVELHRKPPPPETTDLNTLARFDTEVGIPIRRPAFPSIDARFEGARLYASQRARAIQLQYRIARQHRISLYMLDPRILRSAISAGLAAEHRDGTPVYVGHRLGYSLAAAEKNGVGVAAAGDLNDDEIKRIVLAVVSQ